MAHLLYGLEGGEDIILITGEIGSGKTLALHNLANNIKGQYQVVIVNKTQVQFNELIKLVLAEQDIAVPAGSDRADLLMALTQHMKALGRDGVRLLLIIDEAQNLDVSTLEGVRLLTNLGPGEDQRIQIIFAGQPGLRKKIDLPELAQVRQRIRVHYHLESLSAKETAAYIDHRMRVAGCEHRTFSPEAVDVIHRRSCGVPRLVNILADKALLACYVDGEHMVKSAHVPEEDLALSLPGDLQGAMLAARSSEPVSPGPQGAWSSDPKQEEVIEPGPPSRSSEVDGAHGDRGESSTFRGNLRLLLIAAAALAVIVISFGTWQSRRGAADTAPAFSVSDSVVVETVSPALSASDSQFAGALPDSVVDPSMPVSQTDPEILVADTVIDTARAVSEEESSSLDEQASGREGGDRSIAETGYVLDLVGPCIHVASFLTIDHAEVMRDQLSHVSDRTAILRVAIAEKTWFRVYSGPWDSMEQAQRNEAAIRESHVSDWTLLVMLK